MVLLKRGVLLLIALGLFIASCDKVQEERIPPVILLQGNNPDTLLAGCNYTEPGAVIVDDGEVYGYSVSGEVNSDTAGVYYLDYTAWDADSNYAFEQRRVVVEPLTEEFFIGNFTAFDTLVVIPREKTEYPVNISQLSQNQYLFRISNFNNFGSDFNLLIQPDSTGNFNITYEDTVTIVQGQGWVKCNYSGLHLNYTIETPDEFQTHKVTYR